MHRAAEYGADARGALKQLKNMSHRQFRSCGHHVHAGAYLWEESFDGEPVEGLVPLALQNQDRRAWTVRRQVANERNDRSVKFSLSIKNRRLIPPLAGLRRSHVKGA